MSSDSTSDDMNEIVEPNIPAVPSKSIEFPYSEYTFMVVPTESNSSESPDFLAMIQQMVSNISSFTDRLEFIPESSISLAEFDVCHPRHHISLILSSLGVMPRVPTALHLPVAHIDITGQITICNDTYKFAAHPYNIL